jgi:hypothetical protein
MRPAVFIVLLIGLLVPACDRDKDKAKDQAGATQPAATGGVANPEISANPQVLYDTSVSPVEFMLYGVKIGDGEAAISVGDRTGAPDESGWVGYRGRPNVFRIENGKVMNISVTDPQILSKLDIKSEADLTQKFGKGDKTEQFGPDDPAVPFFFKDRWLNVTWDRKQGKVTAVNIGP